MCLTTTTVAKVAIPSYEMQLSQRAGKHSNASSDIDNDPKLQRSVGTDLCAFHACSSKAVNCKRVHQTKVGNDIRSTEQRQRARGAQWGSATAFAFRRARGDDLGAPNAVSPKLPRG
jgi:hypothetical protein